jgi:hypothetical protein
MWDKHRRTLMADKSADLAELDQAIAAIRDNLRELVEQAAGYSGAADEQLSSQRIVEQERQLAVLTKRRDELSRSK